MTEIRVIKCPVCGDMWELKGETPKECLCFRCKSKYIPDKIYTMWRFVYDLVKKVKSP